MQWPQHCASASFSSSARIPFPSRRSAAIYRPCPSRRRRPTLMACAADTNLALLEAAKHAVDRYVRNGMVIGLGSGCASCLAIQYLGGRMRDGALQDIVGIPMSVSSATEAAKAGIPLELCRESLQIDFAFDDADVIEEGSLTAVIGRRKLEGGDSIIQEKVWRRPTSGHAGPMGGDFPLVTEDGHHILDVIFTSPIHNLAEVAESLNRVDGVVDHGVICGISCIAIIASENGVMVVDNSSR
ncbi:Ribose-5-phosphate isomerase protein [Dioscorea alata]|uniref:Ribose-5-phosphate isomerase protein n=1 Tax=Dioscorea alata TaxID=55571 RepID=A0ACB7UKY1_DIOAL|nr:Ribose-5-phosphate isomerase protein [Dioscorea alata]